MIRSRPRRRGFALIEVVVVLFVIAVLTALCGVLLGRLLRVERSGRQQLAQGTNLARLARTWRADVHAAQAASIPPESAGPPPRGQAPAALWLDLADGRRIAYRIAPGRITRIGRDEDEPASREPFELPAKAEARVAIEERGGRTVVVLALEPPAGVAGAGPLRGARVEAVLGRSRRFDGEDRR